MNIQQKTDLAMLLKGILFLKSVFYAKDPESLNIFCKPNGQYTRDVMGSLEERAERLVKEFAQSEYEFETDPHRMD